MIVNALSEIKSPPIFYRLNNFVTDCQVYLKLEGLNIAGSIKLKTATWMIHELEQKGSLGPGKTVICSSSGNLAIALAIVCKEKQYPLICVSDPNLLPMSEQYLSLFGAKLIKVNQVDESGGFLQTRLRLIEEILSANKDYVFVDQYASEDNINAHYLSTAQEILSNFKELDYLVVGAGTTGTLMGCCKLFREQSPNTKIIAVDAVGSVTFGAPSKKRHIPGLGTSFKPPIAAKQEFDDLVYVEEKDTIKMCHQVLENYGLLLGGSTGTVLQGVKQYHDCISKRSSIVAISPDFGDRYINTVYQQEWLKSRSLVD